MSKTYKVFIIGNPKNQDSVNNVWKNNNMGIEEKNNTGVKEKFTYNNNYKYVNNELVPFINNNTITEEDKRDFDDIFN